MKLGVNVDHIATLRQARGTAYPDPVVGALLTEYAGCDSVVVHLREDKRHIRERDVALIKKTLKIPLNLEMSVNKSIVSCACDIVPIQATLVPERRQELTTEGGLDLSKNCKKIEFAVKKLKNSGIRVSFFLDPIKQKIKLAKELGADIIEINTGKYSESKTTASYKSQIKKIKEAARFAKQKGFFVAAGHGLDYENTKAIIKIKDIEELNIGHSIICRSVFTGMVSAVEEMLALLDKGA